MLLEKCNKNILYIFLFKSLAVQLKSHLGDHLNILGLRNTIQEHRSIIISAFKVRVLLKDKQSSVGIKEILLLLFCVILVVVYSVEAVKYFQ